MMNESGFNRSTLVKKSPVVIVKNFIVLQLTAVALFFLAGVLADYGEIYQNLPLASSFSYHIVQAAGIFLFETILIFYIFFRWYKEYYDIQNDKVVLGSGIIFRKKTVIPLGTVTSVDYRQGPLARLTKYGTIELKTSSLAGVAMDHIPEPQHYAELIAHFKNNIRGVETSGQSGLSIEDIISKGEHERLEFKTSFRWDIHQNKVNKNLEKSVMKTVVAFLNSDGGQLVIGVDDSGNALGLENDYVSLPKQNFDSFQNHFTNVFHSMVGPELRQFVELSTVKIGNNECCLVRVMPAGRPAYLKLDSGEEFFIRTGNGTTSLKLSEVSSYIDSHFRGKLV